MALKGWNVELLVGRVDVPQGFHAVGVVGLARVVVLLVVLAVVVDEVVVSSRTAGESKNEDHFANSTLLTKLLKYVYTHGKS